MQTTFRWTMPWMAALLAVASLGCSKEEAKPEAKPTASATKPAPPPPATTEAPVAPPAPKLREDCPAESSGEGTFDKPCEAKGASRMMEVAWTKKVDEKGPYFRVVNKTKSAILYGRIAVYFYDKKGKQLEVAGTGEGAKPKPFHTCAGNMFGGIVKPEEKFTLTFSCVKKERIPEGTDTIEAEMQTVGFADATEKHVDYYWRNNELTPDERPKGGVKPPKAAKGKK